MSLRAWCFGTRLVPERFVIRETFRAIEGREASHLLEPVLRNRSGGAAWVRRHHDQGGGPSNDPGRVWQSSDHAAPDGRTPLMCALQAKPRYAFLAALASQGIWALAAQAALESSSSLRGRTLTQARAVLEAGGIESLGDAARAAATHWRESVATLLLRTLPELASLNDRAGRGALHYAAAAGDSVVLRALVSAGADVNARDNWGRTAAHVAASHRSFDLTKELFEGPREVLLDGELLDIFGHSASDILRVQMDAGSEIQVQESMPLGELFREYVAVNRPVLIRGGLAKLPAAIAWKEPQKLLDALGNVQMSSSAVPYLNPRPTTLERFQAEKVAGEYIFDVSVAGRLPEVLARTQFFTPSVCKAALAYLRLPQFVIGYAGAGAPMHMHHAALNGLFKGTKRWFLAPPEEAFWIAEPAASWVAGSHHLQLQQKGKLLEVTQEAGDLLFVPEGWAHSTLCEDFCVGVGQEFIPHTSLAS